MYLRTWLGVLAIVVVACTSSSGPTNVGGTLEGNYTGTHVFSFGGVPGIACEGTLVINDVTAGTFHGTLVVNSCPPLTTMAVTFLIQGTITGQTLAFTFVGQDEFIQSIEDQLGCTATRVDSAFAGIFTSGHFDAAFTATVTCEDAGSGEFVWSVAMQKAS